MSRPGRYSAFGLRQNRATRSFEPKLVAAATAVVYDQGTIGGGLTFSHTCTGTNRYLIVQIALGTGTDTISGVTYFGTAMTLLRRTAGSFSEELWGLVNPASGAHNVVITRGTGSGGMAQGAISFTNVDQTTPVETGSGTGASGSGITSLSGPSQTTNSGGMIVEGIASNGVTATGATQTGWNDGGGDGGFYLLGTGSAQQTSYTIGAGNYAVASVALNAVGLTGPAGTAYTDANTPVVAITPSSTDLKAVDYADSTTTPVVITASATELHEITDANTARVTLTPSSTDLKAVDYLESGTPVVAITPSSVDLHEISDANTVAVAITPSGADVYSAGVVYTDATTPIVAITPSSVEIHEITDANTAIVKITPSATDIKAIDYVDSGTVGVVITPTSITAGGVVVNDTASRTITAASNTPWGTTDSGHVWVVGSPFFAANATVMGVNGSQLTMVMPATTTNRRSQGIVGVGQDVEILAKIGMSAQPAGSSFQCIIAGRLTDSSNYYETRLTFSAGAIVSLKQTARVATVETTPTGGASVNIDTGYTGTQFYWVRFNINGSTLSSKAWKDGTSEPGAWTMQSTDTQLTTGSSIAFVAFGSAGTSADDTFLIDEFDAAQLNVIGGADIAQFADTGTVSLAITPTGVDTYSAGNTYTDAITVPIALTPSVVEAAQFVDAVTVPLAIGLAASTEARVSTDSANVPVAFTPSATEGAQFADTANVPLLLSPSTLEAAVFADAVSVGVALTPASTDTALVVESATIPVLLTPSAAEIYGRVLTDTGTVLMTLSPSAQESAQRADAGTVPVLLTNSGSEFVIAGLFDADTAVVHITPSIVEVADLVDSANVPFKLSVTFTEVPERAFLDSNTVSVAITPTTTFEDLFKTDVSEVPVRITPYALSEFQGDGDIVPVHITAALAEIFVHDDSNVIILNIDGSSLEVTSLTTMGTVLFTIAPSVVTVFEGVDQATILVTIAPGVVFEVQQVADYLLVGVISNKWTAILRDSTYSGTLHDTRYVVVGFDNRWSYHYRGRGDE